MGIKPFIIGIAGNSGSGKSLFTERLVDILGRENTLIIPGDDYHKWPRGAKEWETYTHLNPEANHLALAAENLSDLKKGLSVYKLSYDHGSGQLVGPTKIEPQKYIIFEGLHSFISNQLQEVMDFKIFLDTSQKLNNHFKIHRDMRERGYSKEKIMEAILKRTADVKKYIIPQRKFADLVILQNPLIPLKDEKEETAVEYTFIHNSNIDLEPLKKLFLQFFTKKTEFYLKKGSPKIKIKNILSKKELADITNYVRKNFDLPIEESALGISQLITAFSLNYHGRKIGRLPSP